MTNKMALHRDGPVAKATLEAWFEGELSAKDASALRGWVAESTPWRDAYRDFLGELAGECVVPRLDARRSIHVATSAAEFQHARLIDDLPLPHLGPQARREGRLTVDGTTWRLLGSTHEVADVASAYGTQQLVWNDPVLGALEIRLRELEADRARTAHDAFVSIARLADGLQHPRALAIAQAVAEDLEQGTLREGLVAAQHAFIHAKLDDDQEQAWVVCALETQLALDRLGHRLCDPTLDEQLLAVDKSLAPLGDALMLLDGDRYAELVHEHDVDMHAWWGYRARLDVRMPDARLEAGFDAIRAEASQAGNVVQLGDHRKRFEDQATSTTYGTSHAAESTPIYRIRAAAASNDPGTVSVLVSLHAPGTRVHGEGQVLRATIKRGGSGNPFAQCPWFGPLAREAIRDAYTAVGERCRDGVPPCPLEDHTIVLDLPKAIESVDGSSLGLAFALGFASLWTNTSIEGGLAATGRLHRGRDAWSVCAVDHVAQKAAALHAYEDREVALVVAREHEAAVRGNGLQAVRVSSVAEALRAAKLDVSGVPGAWPDRASKAAALKALLNRVHDQDVARFGGFGNPWNVLGYRIESLIDALEGAKSADLVQEARPLAALAYVHAGALGAARRVLASTSLGAASAVVKLSGCIVALGHAIDVGDLDGVDDLVTALDAALAQIPPNTHPDLIGQALGTKGRARLHAREFGLARDLFAEAVEHHAAHLPEQLGRSRVYLAAALRRLGRLDEAADVLQQAEQDLGAHTRRESVPYFHACHTYLLYERARLHVARGDGQRALVDAEDALQLTRHRGFWPKLGILRVKAWAHRLLGDPDLAQRCVEEIEGLDVGEHAALAQRVLEEAQGMPRPGGEVY